MSEDHVTKDLLAIDGLSVAFDTETGRREVLSDVSLNIGRGEILGVVGESGSGKSVTSLAVMGLLGAQGQMTRGDIRFDGVSQRSLDEAGLRARRGREMAMIFQEPMTSLNPILRVGFQIEEVLTTHLGLSRAEARERGIALLQEVGVPDPVQRYDDYPHAFSGGMRQRVMIAIAMACEPKLLIADEPTTALDVTIQAQILHLIGRLRADRGSSVMLITHDMGVIARMADRIAVMYAGEVVETAPAAMLFAAPLHPYTQLLLKAIPTTRRKVASLPVIAGQMPAPGSVPVGCRFRARCPFAAEGCAEPQAARDLGEGRSVRCWRAGNLPAVAA